MEKRKKYSRKKSTFFPQHVKRKWIDVFCDLVKKDLDKLDMGKMRTSNLTGIEKGALKTLKENDKIIVKPSDKGGSIVIQNKENYNKECLRLLGDNSTYKKLRGDPSGGVIRELKEWIDTFQKDEELTEKYTSVLHVAESAQVSDKSTGPTIRLRSSFYHIQSF